MRRGARRFAASLPLSETKLRDFEARLGATFPHERYIDELSALRDELKVALSATSQEGTEPKARTAGELSDLIKALKETHTVEAVPVEAADRGEPGRDDPLPQGFRGRLRGLRQRPRRPSPKPRPSRQRRRRGRRRGQLPPSRRRLESRSPRPASRIVGSDTRSGSSDRIGL